MSKQLTWKGVLARAIDDQECNTPLLKLARVTFNAGEKVDVKSISKAWLAHATETCNWAMSPAAGDGQILSKTDLPPDWLKAVGEINQAILIGVDFNKVTSYHNMGKLYTMVDNARKKDAAKGAHKSNKAAAKVIDKPKDHVPTLAEAAAEGEEDVPILDEPANDDALPELSPIADPADEPSDHPDEPEQKDPPSPKPEKEEEVTPEDIEFARRFVTKALESGQDLDPEKLVFAPVELLLAIKQFNELTEGKRSQLAKGVNGMIKSAYQNHLKEVQEGKRRQKKSEDDKVKKEEARAKQHGKDATVVALPDKDEDDTRPPVRSAKEKSLSDDALSDDDFASLIA